VLALTLSIRLRRPADFIVEEGMHSQIDLMFVTIITVAACNVLTTTPGHHHQPLLILKTEFLLVFFADTRLMIYSTRQSSEQKSTALLPRNAPPFSPYIHVITMT
jgi:hypothetical protein